MKWHKTKSPGESSFWFRSDDINQVPDEYNEPPPNTPNLRPRHSMPVAFVVLAIVIWALIVLGNLFL